MNATLFLSLILVFVIGILFIVLGFRGRRINRHPQCRQCGFDLEGIYPASVTCSECGAGLKRPGAVRNGVRRRNFSLIFAGALIALVPLLPIAVVIYSAATGANLNKHKPLWLLLAEARFASATTQGPLAAEVLDRIVTQKLTPAETLRAASTAVAIQRDRSVPWAEQWGDIVERTIADDSISADDKKSYLQHLAVPELVARQTVRAGEPLPLGLKLTDRRLGPQGQFMTRTWLTSARLGDKTLTRYSKPDPNLTRMVARLPASVQPTASVNSLLIGYSYIYAKSYAWMSADATTLFACTIPADAKPGPARINLQLTIANEPMNQNRGNIAQSVIQGIASGIANRGDVNTIPAGAKVFTLAVDVEILPPERNTLELLPAVGITSTKLALGLRPTQISIQEAPSYVSSGIPFLGGGRASTYQYLSIQFALPTDCPPIAYDVFLSDGEKEHPLGSLCTESSALDANNYGYRATGDRTRYLSVSLPTTKRPLGETADLILKPNPELARLTLAMTKLYNAPITIKDIPIVTIDARGQTVTKKETPAKSNKNKAPAKPGDEKSDEEKKDEEK